MATTLLNPGCVPSCYDCCAKCTDYIKLPTPDTWYALICDTYTINTGYANRVLQPDGYYYYWQTNTLGNDLYGLLLSWNFNQSGTTVELDVPGEYRIRSKQIVLPAAFQVDIKAFRHTDFSAPESSYDFGFGSGQIFRFRLFAYVWITDKCGVRTAQTDINGVFVPTNIGNPEGIVAKPTTLNPLIRITQDEPGVSCASVMEGLNITFGEFETLEHTPVYKPPQLIGTLGSSIPSLKVAVNDGTITC